MAAHSSWLFNKVSPPEPRMGGLGGYMCKSLVYCLVGKVSVYFRISLTSLLQNMKTTLASSIFKSFNTDQSA